MKKTVKFFGLAAIASMALVSCQKESLAPASEAKMVEMTVHGGPDALTKTVLQEDGTVLWGEGEKLVVFQTVGETTTFATSSEGVTTDGGQTMTFGVAFAENPDASAFTYNAVYPASIYIVDEKPNVAAIRALFPSIQKPTATSYDAAADLLIAKPLEATEQPSDLLLAFRRMVGIGKMTIKNLASTANVREVVFTAKHAGEEAAAPILAGRTHVNLTEGTAEYGYDSPSNSLTLDYSGQTIAANGMTAYFASLPFALAEGDSFTVAVTTTDGKVFTKEVTLPAGKTLAVKVGRSSTFSVNMTGAEEEEVADLEGEYIVIGKTSTDWRYMKPELGTGNNGTYILVNETGVTLEANKLDLTSSATNFPTVTETWTVEKSGDNYAIKSKSGKYVSWTSGNSATLSDNPYELKISKLDNGSYEIVSVADNTRKLRFNSGSPRFAFYTSAQTDVYMIPYVANTKPIIVVDNDVMEIPSAGGEFAIYPTVLNIDGDINATTDASWIEIGYAGSDEVDFEVAANTGEARTATIVLSYEGAEDVVVTVNQLAASGNDGSTPEKAFTASEAYAFVSNMAAGVNSTDMYYIKGIITEIAKNGTYSDSGEYGNASFYITDDGDENGTKFYAFRVLYLKNEKWVSGNTDIKVGDEVIIYGKVVNYKGNTPETVQNEAYLYSLNGKTSDEGDDPTPTTLTDVLDRALTEVTGSTYTDWSGKKSNTDAVYAGNSAGSNNSIQLRSKNSNSGIITTASGGNVKKIVVTWNSSTLEGRTLNIYGSNTAYSSPADLYDTSKQGELLGTLVYGTSTELTVTGDYAFFGIRSAADAQYLEKVEITWE